MKPMEKITIEMAHKKSTKNTEVYENEDSNTISVIYVKKDALPKKAPPTIFITLAIK